MKKDAQLWDSSWINMILTGGCLFRLFYEEKEKDKIGIAVVRV
jgi:hypothetical protein